MDDDRRRAFAGKLLSTSTGGALTLLISLGHRTGLFEAAAGGPATSEALAARAGLRERYVREWLGAMVTGGFFTYEPESREYTLPPEHAVLLTGDTAANLAPTASMLRGFAGVLPGLERAFETGGGVSHEEFAASFEAAGARFGDTWRQIYDEQLVDGFFAVVPGLNDRLTAGASLLDLGCGTGHAVNVAAQAFPSSRFLGIDISEQVIAMAEAERDELGLGNAAFAVGDAARLPAQPGFDVITAFDSVHDQHSPQEVLRRIRAALAPDGVFVMVDAKFSSHLENNVGNPLAPLCYSISLIYCTSVSLAEGGAGLGAMWGTELAGRMLAEAGFGRVEVYDSPRPQNCVYVCRA
ncbi:class I SAM-dependent methyltransferase [Amycolatopsis sp. H20-H5]|uniref:class I SAM-dependent methyltransferase n=1 Tax=Amycolatopsis sp. H20-H5 TaxID=3046309 RepID=UPI002DBC889E|nr:class I SAM-dependent methyltransferase [Amycolatopsis sp. H20-H5]MEC3976056.1 class I SAM-dependent methyltransferase [Amycolatopsis sp. H20-H5]